MLSPRALFALALMPFLPAWAADAETATFVVTAPRVAAETANPAPGPLPGNPAEIADKLNGIPGLQVDSRSNPAQDTRISLRGFGARSAFGVRGVFLQLDGIPLTLPDGQGQISGLLLDDVQLQEVITGPLAALYGNGAGGVVALRSRPLSDRQIAAAVLGDETGLARQQMQGRWSGDALALGLATAALDAPGSRPQSAAERRQTSARGDYTLAESMRLHWRSDWESAPLLQDPLGLSLDQWRSNPQQIASQAEQFNTRKSLQQRQHSLSLSQDEDQHRWQLAAWRGERNLEQYLALMGDAPSSAGGLVVLARDYGGAYARYSQSLEPLALPGEWSLGLDYSQMRDARLGFENLAGFPGAKRRDETDLAANRDIYTSWQEQQGAWFWLAGARNAQVDLQVQDHWLAPGNGDDSGRRQFQQTSWALASRYQWLAAWSLGAALGEGFETPSLTEMAYSRSGGFNAGLQPAVNQQQELSLAYSAASTQGQAKLFAVRTANELVVDQSLGGRTSYRNAAHTQRQGAEFLINHQWSPRWQGQLSATYLSAQFRDGALRDRQLPGLAPRQFNAQLRWQAERHTQLLVQANRRAGVFSSDDNRQQAPAYTCLDLALESQFLWGENEVQTWLRLSNLTDTTYIGSVIVNQANERGFEPAPGRVLSAGLRLAWDY